MNKQTGSMIEWTNFTWNPVAGCLHGCEWRMPDGSIAECYAKTIAEKFTKAYPLGFEHDYWHGERLREPFRVAEPARIFLDSMSDLMGAWVDEKQIEQVLSVCRTARWHTFQLLTKNAPRLRKFTFPANVWVGVSAPPTFYRERELTRQQQIRMLMGSLHVLRDIQAGVKWMSIEPLSFDMAPCFVNHPLDWVVIGAASNGRKVYQPEPNWVENLLEVFARTNTPVFFKGNLRGNPAATVWREEYPADVPAPFSPALMQQEMF